MTPDIQALVDKHYTPAYDKAWQGYSEEWTDVRIQIALDRCQKAWERAAARILRETGYSV